MAEHIFLLVIGICTLLLLIPPKQDNNDAYRQFDSGDNTTL